MHVPEAANKSGLLGTWAKSCVASCVTSVPVTHGTSGLGALCKVYLLVDMVRNPGLANLHPPSEEYEWRFCIFLEHTFSELWNW
jgi:hypothetical protein